MVSASHKPLGVLVRVARVAGPGLTIEARGHSPGYYAHMRLRLAPSREMSGDLGVMMSLIMWNFRPDKSN